MSYILDALRKSDRERALGNVPRLDTVQPVDPARRGLWLWLILGFVLSIGLAMTWWWWQGRDAAVTIPAPQSAPAPAPTIGSSTLPAPSANESQTTGAVPGPEPAAGSAPPVDAAPVPFGDLPEEIRRSLPELAVNVLSSSTDAQKRFVMINLKVYHEGDVLKAGPKVEQITEDAVVLSFRNYRFTLHP